VPERVIIGQHLDQQRDRRMSLAGRGRPGEPVSRRKRPCRRAPPVARLSGWSGAAFAVRKPSAPSRAGTRSRANARGRIRGPGRSPVFSPSRPTVTLHQCRDRMTLGRGALPRPLTTRGDRGDCSRLDEDQAVLLRQLVTRTASRDTGARQRGGLHQGGGAHDSLADTATSLAAWKAASDSSLRPSSVRENESTVRQETAAPTPAR